MPSGAFIGFAEPLPAGDPHRVAGRGGFAPGSSVEEVFESARIRQFCRNEDLVLIF